MDIELQAERVKEVSSAKYSGDVDVTLTMDSDQLRKNVRELVEKMFDYTLRKEADRLLSEFAKAYLTPDELRELADEAEA